MAGPAAILRQLAANFFDFRQALRPFSPGLVAWVKSARIADALSAIHVLNTPNQSLTLLAIAAVQDQGRVFSYHCVLHSL
jgi:hypothetical protein